MIHRLFFVLAFLLSFENLHSQIELTQRVEFPLKAKSDAFITCGLEENGLITYRHVRSDEQDLLQLIKLDTALQEQWKGTISLNLIAQRLNVVRAKYYRNILYFLLKDLSNDEVSDFFLLTVSMTGKYESLLVKNSFAFVPTEFCITNQAALIGGTAESRPIVLYYDFTQKNSIFLPGFFETTGELNQLKTYEDGTADIVLQTQTPEKRKILILRNYAANGRVLRSTIIRSTSERNLIFGKSARRADGTQIVTGLFGGSGEFSDGVFTTVISDSDKYSIRYFGFSEFKNFFSYIREKDEEQAKEKIVDNKEGKNTKLSYLFLVDDILPFENQFILKGEIYSKFYEPYVDLQNFPPARKDFFARAIKDVSRNYNQKGWRTQFEKCYDYSHAVVVGIDAEGKIQWDNSLDVQNVVSLDPEQFIQVKPEADRMILMYVSNNGVQSKVIHHAQVVRPTSNEQMPTGRDKDRLDRRSIQGEQFNAWYGDYFFVSGRQGIKGYKTGTRTVFFVNKIRAK